MNKKLLTEQSLRDDLYLCMMLTAGAMAFHGVHGEQARRIIEKQIDDLMPVVKKHIKRHVKVAKESNEG